MNVNTVPSLHSPSAPVSQQCGSLLVSLTPVPTAASVAGPRPVAWLWTCHCTFVTALLGKKTLEPSPSESWLMFAWSWQQKHTLTYTSRLQCMCVFFILEREMLSLLVLYVCWARCCSELCSTVSKQFFLDTDTVWRPSGCLCVLLWSCTIVVFAPPCLSLLSGGWSCTISWLQIKGSPVYSWLSPSPDTIWLLLHHIYRCHRHHIFG